MLTLQKSQGVAGLVSVVAAVGRVGAQRRRAADISVAALRYAGVQIDLRAKCDATAVRAVRQDERMCWPVVTGPVAERDIGPGRGSAGQAA